MVFSVKIEGLDELDKAFDDLLSGIDDTLDDSLKLASKPILNDIKSKADPKDGTIEFGNVETTNSGAQISLSIDSYIFILKEYGTSKIPATPFIRPAFDKNIDNVVNIFSNQINDKINEVVK